LQDYIQVITTAGKKEDAEKIAKTLIEKRLAGCVQIIGPISSVYWWKNKIETEQEWLCFIKSKAKIFETLEKTIKNVHPYETPEIIALPISKGSNEYLKWLDEEISTK